jgi:Prp8 binding protein
MERNLFKANWDSKGKTIAAGSGDRTVVIWDADSGKLLYKLPGHKGAVNDVVFSPSEEQIGKRYPCRVTILFGNADNFRYSFVWIV